MADYDQIMQALRNAHEAGDTAAAQRLAQMAQEARTPDREVIATTGDGGRIYQLQDGSRAYASPGYSTTDPASIDRLMEGATPANIVQDSRDQQVIEANPARAQQFLEGMPFVGSYIDEAVGVVNPGKRDMMRETSDAMERQNPGQSTALGLAGSVAGAIPAAVAAAPAIVASAPSALGFRMLAGAAGGAAAGATEGAIYGAGEGTDAASRAEEAKQGATFGGFGGAGFGAASPIVGAVIQNAFQRFRKSDVAQIASTLGVSQAAARQIKAALTGAPEQEAVANLARAGGDAMLADAGPGASALLDAAGQAGGDAARIARSAVDTRTAQATSQMNERLDQILGTPAGQGQLVGDVRNRTSAARTEAYDAAYAQPIDYSAATGRSIEALLQRVPPSAVRRANDLMRVEGVQSQQIMARIEGDNVTFERMPDVRQLDYITRALNDVAEEANGKGALGGQTAIGRGYQNLSRSIRQTMRAAVPEYGNALDVAADAIAERRAIDLGYDLLRPNTRRETVVEAMRGASDAEKRAAALGIRSYLDDTTANVARTITDDNVAAREGIRILRDLSSRANRDKLATVIGPRAAGELQDEADRMATAFELRAAIAQNSATARRQSIQQGISDEVSGGTLATLRAGEPIDATKRIVQALSGETPEARQIREMGLLREIAQALTETRGNQARTSLRVIQGAIQGQSITEHQARRIAATLTSGATLSGSHTMHQTLAAP